MAVYSFPVTVTNCKVLRLTGSAIPPSGWETNDFDDSGWPAPVAITPSPAYPKDPSVAGEPLWAIDNESVSSAKMLIRFWFDVPFGLIDYRADRPVVAGAPLSVDCKISTSASSSRFGDHPATSTWFNGGGDGIAAPFFPQGIIPGRLNLLAVMVPAFNEPFDFSPDSRTWIATEMIVTIVPFPTLHFHRTYRATAARYPYAHPAYGVPPPVETWFTSDMFPDFTPVTIPQTTDPGLPSPAHSGVVFPNDVVCQFVRYVSANATIIVEGDSPDAASRPVLTVGSYYAPLHDNPTGAVGGMSLGMGTGIPSNRGHPVGAGFTNQQDLTKYPVFLGDDQPKVYAFDVGFGQHAGTISTVADITLFFWGAIHDISLVQAQRGRSTVQFIG